MNTAIFHHNILRVSLRGHLSAVQMKAWVIAPPMVSFWMRK